MTVLSSCDGSWNFQPKQQNSPLLPAWAVNGYLLTGFDLGADHPVQDIQLADPSGATKLLQAFYPQMSWPELIRLLGRPHIEKYFSFESLMQAFGFGADEHWRRVSEVIKNWPLPVQNYISEKELRPYDLMVLLSLSPAVQVQLLSQLIKLDLSKSAFCQALELTSEILLLGQTWQQLQPKLQGPNFIEELKKDRFPISYFGDQQLKEKVNSIKWPKGIQAQSQRRGDALGIEFKVFAKNREELSKLLKNLETTYEQLDSTL